MIRINIKPLSVNNAWAGRRFKTQEYKTYEKMLTPLLPSRLLSDLKGKLELSIVFGFSSKGSDGDNPLKPFIDILSKKYGFNDNQIYSYVIKKEIVKKGFEFIDFKIIELNG
tara:strand:- start:3344 stop:3679 length:336 start_codon:yes stop_codon:yes gene_type:complete